MQKASKWKLRNNCVQNFATMISNSKYSAQWKFVSSYITNQTDFLVTFHGFDAFHVQNSIKFSINLAYKTSKIPSNPKPLQYITTIEKCPQLVRTHNSPNDNNKRPGARLGRAEKASSDEPSFPSDRGRT